MIPDVFEIFELLEFDNVLRVCDSVDEAIDQFDAATDPADRKKKELKKPD